jgi:F-type H+-transporting ATPase subunit gamma
MAGSKEIRTKIKSVENTRKITKAMEMVAASKMRKAQDRMRAARPYAEKIRNVAAHMSHAEPEYKHAFLVKRDNVKNVGVIVVTSDKGLCGGLNTNVLRVAVNQMQAWEAENLSVKVCAIGNKGLGFMNRINASVQSQLTGLGDAPQMEKLIGPVKVMLDAYVAGEIDQLYVVYNKFINAMKQENHDYQHRLEHYNQTLSEEVAEKTQILQHIYQSDSLTGLFNRAKYIVDGCNGVITIFVHYFKPLS